MIVPIENFQSVTFLEYITLLPDKHNNNPYDISVSGIISKEAYCTALYSKILSISLSESADFIDYQCELHKKPINWLNSLEMLIQDNFVWCQIEEIKYRSFKFMTEIITKRRSLKAESLQNTKEYKLREVINGYTGDKIYCFHSVLELTKSMNITEEKILYLRAQIKDYKQNPPEFESNRKPKFDKQCQLEITELIEAEDLMQKAMLKRKQCPESITKLRVNAELKPICDIYYKLMKKKGSNGQPIYPWTIKEATDFICNSFMDMDGISYNPSTVRTYLSPSKFDSRPKHDKSIDLDE